MSDCQHHVEMIKAFVEGDADAESVHQHCQHCQTCPNCKHLLQLHSSLLNLGESMPEPGEAGLRAMREGVLAQIRHAEKPVQRRSFWSDLAIFLRAHPVAAAVPLAVLLLAAAVMLGRWSVPMPDRSLALDDRLLHEIRQQAALKQGLDEYWDAPFSYTNVALRPQANRNLALSFDACRHIELETPVDSPVASDVLLQAILEPSTLGTRMKAMQMTPQIMDDRLKDALIMTMHSDPNLAVRLEALSVLNRYPYDDAIQKALLVTLQQDQAVQMRLLALDFLTDRRVDPETIRQAIAETELEGDAAVMRHALKLQPGEVGMY